MAICEVCGADVAPGDVVKLGEYTQLHYFCSVAHRNEWVAKPSVVEEKLADVGEGFPSDPSPADDALKSGDEEEDPLRCEVCGFVAKSKGGLAAHTRAKHS